MPNVVFTKNTTPQFTPYGAIDTQYDQIDDTHQTEQSAAAAGYDAPRGLGPTEGSRNHFIIRPEFIHQIPSNAENVQARLYIHTGAGFGDFDVEARSLGKYWLEREASWNNHTRDLAWTTPGALDASDRGAAEDTKAINGSDWYFFDIPLITAALIADPINNTGVGLFLAALEAGFRFIDASSFGADGLLPEWHASYTLPVGGGGTGGIVKSGPIVKDVNLIKTFQRSLIKAGGGSSGPNPVPTPDIRSIMVFGHSLFDHVLFESNEFTKTGWTMGDMSRQSFNFIGVKQIFGQLRDQALPPVLAESFGFPTNQFLPWPSGAWTSEAWDDVIVMASNFEQTDKTAVEFATESDDVLDYVDTNAPTANIVIYEHWSQPEQYGLFVVNDNELSPADFATWIALHRLGGTYHTWHLDYQDQIETNGYTPYMIPIGPILCDALATEAYLSGVEFEDLFVDNAPHGNANCYFFAGLVTYIAMFGEPTSDYVPRQASALLPAFANNVPALISFISSRLVFHGANGVNLPPVGA